MVYVNNKGTKVEQAAEANWSFLGDNGKAKHDGIEWAISSAVRRGVSEFYANAGYNERLEVAEDLRQDVLLWLAVRPEQVSRTLENGEFMQLAQDIYKTLIYEKHVHGGGSEHFSTLSLEEARRVLGQITEAVADMVDESMPAPATVSNGPYTADKVKRLVAVCWFPELLNNLRDPFNEKPVDLAADRKSKSDPSHRFTDVAEMVDMRRALSWTSEVGFTNNAGLTLRQMQSIFLLYALDCTEEYAADSIGIVRPVLRRYAEAGIGKIVNYLNGGAK